MRVKVKVCGVRTKDEARAAVTLGIDALGFNLWPHSPRYVTPETASEIAGVVPPFVARVGVFVDEEPERIEEIVRLVGFDTLQLHGDESPDYCRSLGSGRIIKSMRVGKEFDVEIIRAYSVGAILLDTRVEGLYGGTGRRFDWRVALEAKKLAPIVLAGGLTADNVGEAITTVRPLAVDVCSGVEVEPGRKDYGKLAEFMEAVSRANSVLARDFES